MSRPPVCVEATRGGEEKTTLRRSRCVRATMEGARDPEAVEEQESRGGRERALGLERERAHGCYVVNGESRKESRRGKEREARKRAMGRKRRAEKERQRGRERSRGGGGGGERPRGRRSRRLVIEN